MSRLRAYLCVLGMAGAVLVCVPLQLIALIIGGRAAEPGPHYFFKVISRIIGVKIERHGTISKARPTLFVANHVSWLDIFVMGALLKGSFVARADLASWRLFGWLAKLRRTIFIDRENRARSGAHLELMTGRMIKGDSLILFPEGTSTDGGHVLPFKSSLFAIAERWPGDEPLVVQPVSIVYTRINNMPVSRHWRPYIAWFGDMELGPHLWDALRLGRITAVITFHEPVTLETVASRKEMCAYCYGAISRSVEVLNAGYNVPEPLDDAA